MSKALPDYVMRPVRKVLQNGVMAPCEQDQEFLLKLYMSVREPEMQRANFPVEQRWAFCRSQLSLRDIHYNKFYPNALDRIIEMAGVPVGHELVDRAEPVILLMDIALLPEYRNLGIGGDLLKKLSQEADHSKRTICLHVDKLSPALQLYQRFGFVITDDCDPQFEMRRAPNA